jgi:signal peptidase I
MMKDGDVSTKQKPPPEGMEIRSWWGRILIGRRPRRTLIRLIIVVAVILLAQKWLFLAVKVTGRSMEPTMRDGRISVLNRVAYCGRDPRRGDVVGIQLKGRRMLLLKRIVGLPGERVHVQDGQVWINGQPLHEPYAQGDQIQCTNQESVLRPGQYFVIGDNRNLSEYGNVDRTELKGKVLF